MSRCKFHDLPLDANGMCPYRKYEPWPVEQLMGQVIRRLSREPVTITQLAESDIEIPRMGWANGNRGGRADGRLSKQARHARLRLALAVLAQRKQVQRTGHGWVKL